MNAQVVIALAVIFVGVILLFGSRGDSKTGRVKGKVVARCRGQEEFVIVLTDNEGLIVTEEVFGSIVVGERYHFFGSGRYESAEAL